MPSRPARSPSNATTPSDHGEAPGERPSLLRDAEWIPTDGRRYDHGYPQQIEENLIRIPFLVKLSGRRRRASVSALVSALELFASLLELSGGDDQIAAQTLAPIAECVRRRGRK
jgi:arylsulfatase A-like enzyme